MTTKRIVRSQPQAEHGVTQTKDISNIAQQKEKQVKFVCPEDRDLEVIKVGPAVITILEDGCHTENRFGAVKVSLGPNMPGMWTNSRLAHNLPVAFSLIGSPTR